MTNNQTPIKDLQFADYNPNKMDDTQFQFLKRSIKEYGDLSGIVRNVRTGRLVGGEHRIRVMVSRGEGNIIVTGTYKEPNEVGTVAVGYILLDGSTERFAYREVDWPDEKEKSANMAANKINGEMNEDLHAKLVRELNEIDPNLNRLAGHSQAEIDALLNPHIEEPSYDDDRETMVFKLTAEQAEIVEEALGNIELEILTDASENTDRKANALFALSRNHLDRLHGLKDDVQSPVAD